jgi:hypothetical protein
MVDFILNFRIVFFEYHDAKKRMESCFFNFSKWLGAINRTLSNF